MLNVDERGMASRQTVLAQWVSRAINLQATQVQVRFRGNILHLLCEGQQCPDSAIVVSRLVEALAQADLVTLLPPDPYPTYQIWVYGRGFGSDRPAWSEPIYLHQLDRHLEQVRQLQPPPPDLSSFYLRQPSPKATTTTTTANRPATRSTATPTATTTKPSQRSVSPGSALLVPNETLARQGRPDAIARYLSETLSAMGVAVEVSAKAIPYTPDAATDNPHRRQRLWILCESAYSPDPATLAEPIAQKLRNLALETFQDALVFSQVSGEPQPDWRLRVDLTPPDEMLREWARWGDVQAIARLLNKALGQQQIHATAELKEATLHLVCSSSSHDNGTATAPGQHQVTDILTPLLESLAPQGIHGAALYGQQADQEAPAWIAWLNLPAAEHAALTDSTIVLAQQGDQPALHFLLSRLLNPNLDHRLATGGIRIQVLHKEDLLHVMADAPICPKQKQVGPAIAKFLKQLKLPNLLGVRIYGRRSGQKRPLWSYGADFIARDRLVPEATPEFAASDAYVNELIAQPLEPELRPEFTTEVFQTTVAATTQKLTQGIQRFLVRSQVFVPQDQPFGQIGTQGAKVAIVWGTLGLLLTLQTDWVLGQLLQARAKLATAPAAQSITAQANSAPSPQPVRETATGVPAPPLSLRKSDLSEAADTKVFNASGFTASETEAKPVAATETTVPKTLRAEPIRANAASAAILAAARSPYATFNSRQLDEKLALYHQRLTESGPPDILIIGSSRALRGIDPAALQNALAAQGYPDLSVFNFGINGATAQVVSLVLEKILTPDQMPKLIVWADGARAFNSGRVDITYKAIAASEGYRQVLAQAKRPAADKTAPQTTDTAPNLAVAAAPIGGLADTSQVAQTSLASSYAALNQWLNESAAKVSATYAQRDQLKSLLQTQWSQIGKAQPTLEQMLATQGQFAAPSPNGTGTESADSLLYAIDFDGFLPLSLRFNPATYYQKYAKVSGSYDNDYDSFELEGKQTEALKSLLKFTQTHQVPLVFVNLPLTQDYLDDIRKEHEVEFRQHMLRLSTQNGFAFRDLGELWPTENDYFSDPSHLNRYGAYEVSHHLAKDPMIPWPRSQATSPANE